MRRTLVEGPSMTHAHSPRFRFARAAGVLAFVAAALTALGCGCVSKPTMHLNHAEISGVQLATLPPSIDVQMTIVLDVYNPNGYDVAVRAVRGQTVMAGRYPINVDYRAPGDGLW